MSSFLKVLERDIDFYSKRVYNINVNFSERMMKMSITLIGMPSCGKSTLGVLLAKKLGYRFIDSDLLIQERENALLHQIISEKGTGEFLRIENDVNCSITDTRAVISTGGSAVYGEQAMKHLATLGEVVYLRISLDTMLARLGDYSHRGVVLPEGYTLANMYEERSALYMRYATAVIDIDKEDINTNLEKIYLLAEKG